MIADWCFLDARTFRSQLKYLNQPFEIIPLSAVINRMKAGSIKGPAVAITLDDGFQNNYEVAFSILCEERVPATIFLIKGLIGTNDTMWFCSINRALAITSAALLQWNGCQFDLSTVEAKAKLRT